MIDWTQLAMAMAFGAGGFLAGAGIAWIVTRHATEGRRQSAALSGFVGLALAVGIGQIVFPPPTDAEQIARQIDGEAVFRVAFAHDPGLRVKVIDRLEQAHQKGGQDGYLKESETVAFELSQQYFPLMVSSASAEALDRFLDFAIAMIEDRYEIAPDICYATVSGTGAAAGGLSDLPQRLQRQAQEAMDAVAESAESEAVALSGAEREEAAARLTRIVTDLTEGPERQSLYVADYASHPAITPEARKGACLFSLRLHQAMKAVPQPQRAALLRVVMGPQP